MDTTKPGKEVSCKAFENFIVHLKKIGVSYDDVFRGMPLSYEYVTNPKNYVDWDVATQYWKKFSDAIGGHEELVRMGLDSPKVSASGPIMAIVGWIADARMIYKMLIQWFAPTLFRNLKFTFSSPTASMVKITMEIPEQYHGSEEFFHIWRGGLSAAPTTIGLPAPRLDAHITDRIGEYTIYLPLSMTIVSRFRRAWRVIFRSRAAIEEMITQERALTEQHQRIAFSEGAAVAARLSSLGVMAGGVAHEINNPLMILLGYSELLLKLAESNKIDPQVFVDRLRKVNETIRRIQRVVNSLTHLSGVNVQRATAATSVPAQQLVDYVLDLCRTKVETSGVRLEIPVVDPRLSVVCVEMDIGQVLFSLISNAMDALEKTKDKFVRIEVRSVGKRVQFDVIDSGPGVPPSVKEKIFDPFFTTKDVGKGTGLGLAYSKQVVSQHGGNLILVAGAANTTFRFDLEKA